MNRVSRLPIRRNNKKRYYKHIEYPEIAREINDLYIITSFGDRLDTLAHLYYGDSSLWWAISSANPNLPQDSYYPPEGIQIRIPSNVGNIVNNFELLNQ